MLCQYNSNSNTYAMLIRCITSDIPADKADGFSNEMQHIGPNVKKNENNT